MTVEAIKEAITKLAEEERFVLASWIIEREYDAWDKQMVNDFSPGGRGGHVVERIKRQVDTGQFRPMNQRSWERPKRA